MFNIPPQFLAQIVQQLGSSGGLPGGKGGGLPTPIRPGAPPPMPQMPAQPQVPQFASPMTGAAPGQMPNIREAMMQNIMGSLGRPNFGIQQQAPRGLGRPAPVPGMNAGLLPNQVSPVPIGYRGMPRSTFARG